MSNTKEGVQVKRERYPLLDIIRGGCLISMVLFHTVWDLIYIYDVNWTWFGSVYGMVWQQSICWTFILLAGFCVPLSSHPVKHGAIVFGCGALITAVTLILMPGQRIIFGVLTLLGSSMMLVGALDKVMRKMMNKISGAAGAIGSFLLFALTYSVNDHFIGVFGKGIADLPDELYQNYFTTFLGFPQGGFFSTDYFSIFPWIFLFLTGYFMHFVVMNSGVRALLKKGNCKVLSWIGKHSLIIYMFHQPVVYGVLWVVFKIF